MPVFAGTVAAVTVLSLLFVALMHLAVRRVLGRRVPIAGPRPGVSILKPLRGIDDELDANLESFAHQLYGEYEILLGAEDPGDPALAVARAFQRRHPGRAIRVIVCDRPFGLNPKVNVLAELARHARHPVILISDSNVRVRPSFLADTAAELGDPKVALVTNVVIGTGEASVGSALENAHLNSFISGAVCGTSHWAGKACVLGKSMMMWKAVFDHEIGWRALRGILAEDYFTGHRFEAAGWKVALASHPVYTVNKTWSVDRFLSRHVRWNQLRRRLSPPAYAGELLLNPTPWALASIALGLAAGNPWCVAIGLFGLKGKIASDLLLARRLGTRMPNPVVVIAKDLLLPVAWSLGAVKKSVAWRGNRFRLGRHTRLQIPIQERPGIAAATRSVA